MHAVTVLTLRFSGFRFVVTVTGPRMHPSVAPMPTHFDTETTDAYSFHTALHTRQDPEIGHIASWFGMVFFHGSLLCRRRSVVGDRAW